MMPSSSANRYFVCLSRGQEPIPWSPSDPKQAINVHSAYFGGVLTQMERQLDQRGLCFYLTWDVGRLPTYGNDVVAVVLGDEWARLPSYSNRIRATFKCYGTQPTLGCNPLKNPSYKNVLTLAHFLKTVAAETPGFVRQSVRRIVSGRDSLRPVFDIPLGYANQLDLPIKDIAGRPHDVSFAGSVVHRPYKMLNLRYWLQTPKSLSRREMIEAMQHMRSAHPEWSVDLKTTESYRAIRTADPVAYSQRMMDTKISLVPRGTSFETFRFFEAMRYGCVVVTEALPSRWFYDGSPAIQIDRWAELEPIVADLLSDPERLRSAHTASLEWWLAKCSERAVGTFIAERLNALAREQPPS